MYEHENSSAPSFQSSKDVDREQQKIDSKKLSPERKKFLENFPRNELAELIKEKEPTQKNIWDDTDFSDESESEEEEQGIGSLGEIEEEKIENWREDPALPKNRNFEQYVKDSVAGMAKYTQSPDYDREKLDLLYRYTGPDFSGSNASMRRADPQQAANLAKPYVDTMDALMKIEELRVEKGPLFRGRKRQVAYVEGQVVRDPAPMSCSTDPSCAAGYADMSGSKNPDRQGIQLFIYNAVALNISGANIVGQMLPEDSSSIDISKIEAKSKSEYGYAIDEAEAMIKPGEEFNVLLKARDPRTGQYKAILEKKEELKQPEQPEAVKAKRRFSR